MMLYDADKQKNIFRCKNRRLLTSYFYIKYKSIMQPDSFFQRAHKKNLQSTASAPSEESSAASQLRLYSIFEQYMLKCFSLCG